MFFLSPDALKIVPEIIIAKILQCLHLLQKRKWGWETGGMNKVRLVLSW